MNRKLVTEPGMALPHTLVTGYPWVGWLDQSDIHIRKKKRRHIGGYFLLGIKHTGGEEVFQKLPISALKHPDDSNYTGFEN